MGINIEIEYKCMINKEVWEDLIQTHSIEEDIVQSNTYFDTESNALRERKSMMRIRTIQNQHVIWIKIPKDKIGVWEYSCPVSTNTIEAFNEPEAKKLLESLSIYHPIKKLGTLTTHRLVHKTRIGEYCFDHNTYNGIEDYEIEYEISDDFEPAKNDFIALLAPYNISYTENCPSKLQRFMESIDK